MVSRMGLIPMAEPVAALVLPLVHQCPKDSTPRTFASSNKRRDVSNAFWSSTDFRKRPQSRHDYKRIERAFLVSGEYRARFHNP
jgi:hypothetical protein